MCAKEVRTEGPHSYLWRLYWLKKLGSRNYLDIPYCLFVYWGKKSWSFYSTAPKKTLLSNKNIAKCLISQRHLNLLSSILWLPVLSSRFASITVLLSTTNDMTMQARPIISKHRPSGPMLSISRFVHIYLCVCVRLCVHSLGSVETYIFLPPFLEAGCPKFLELQNLWEKVIIRSGIIFDNFYKLRV